MTKTVRWIAALVALLVASLSGHANAGDATHSIDRISIDPIDEPQGATLAGRTIGVSFESSSGEGVTVDPAAVRLRLSCMAFCSHDSAETIDGATGSSFVEVPIPPSTPFGVYGVSMLAAPHAARFASEASIDIPETPLGVVSIPPFVADGEDEHLVRIRHEYVGRTVQGYGPLVLECDDPLAVSKERARTDTVRDYLKHRKADPNHTRLPILPPGPHTGQSVGNEPSLVVASIDRPDGPPGSWKIGGPMEDRSSGDDHFVSIEPLLVTFEATSATHGCIAPRARFADDWEVRRMLWIHDPVAVLSTAPIVIGMAKETVAHILGYPAEFGMRDEVLRLDRWHYLPVLPPFDSTVYFAHGRVRRYDPPGRPP